MSKIQMFFYKVIGFETIFELIWVAYNDKTTKDFLQRYAVLLMNVIDLVIIMTKTVPYVTISGSII